MTRRVSVYAADARSMKRRDLNAATRNAASRAKDKLIRELTKEHFSPKDIKGFALTNIRCVG
jgi:hypothetical protein